MFDSSVSFSGIVSGLDTSAIIEATAQMQRLPINRMAAKRSSYQMKISGLGKLTSSLNELKTLMEDMQDTSNVLSYTSTSSDEDILTASIGGAASSGSYELDITQLAKPEKDRSVAMVSEYQGVKAGTITLTTPGEDPVDIVVADGETLRDVRDKINSSGAAVEASMVFDGTSYYLQMVATESGFEIGGAAADAIQITETYTGTTGTELGMTQVTQAQNALFTLDGLPVEQRANEVGDVLTDVDLELVTTGQVNLNIDADRDGTKEQLQAFVDKYNEVLKLVKGQTQNADGARNADADPLVMQIKNDMRALIGSGVSGSNEFSQLSQLGIVTDQINGQLKIDEDSLNDAMDKSIRGIGEIFTLKDTGIAQQFLDLVEKYTDSTDGSIVNRKKSIQGRIDATDQRIERMEARVERSILTMRRQFTSLETSMSGIQMQGSALSALLF